MSRVMPEKDESEVATPGELDCFACMEKHVLEQSPRARGHAFTAE